MGLKRRRWFPRNLWFRFKVALYMRARLYRCSACNKIGRYKWAKYHSCAAMQTRAARRRAKRRGTVRL